MTLEDGINLYVQRKHAAGMSFQEGRKVYRSFLKMVGNMPLSQITIDHVSRFLNRPDTSAGAFRVKHSLLRRLFEFCSVHGAMERLTMPLNRPAQRSTFLPYIYTRDELRSMLRKAPTLKMANDTIDHRTLRAALVVLYATGATPSEVTKLVNGDVDLRIGYINFPGSRLKSERRIPIGRDLARVARIYLEWKKRTGRHSRFLFSRIDGEQISPRALRAHFECLRRRAGIAGYRESSQRPCLRDLRATFAVHQIDSWLTRRQDLGLMLPALAAYMGYVGLESTERYLRFTPQRFQSALNKLSPQDSQPRWKKNPALLEFLANF